MSTSNKSLIKKSKLTYKEMQSLASCDDVEIRCKLAERQDIKAEVLYFLAEDDNIEVRRRVAQNPATPRQADLLLARDKEETVRLQLSEKIANLAPGITAAETSKIESLTYDALFALSRDQATNVRQILSETLKEMVDAPNDIIKHLAKDVELVVSGPVLQFSPVLTDEDLLEIISSSHADGALSAIAKRQAVSPSVSDAVIASNEEAAIADLLANKSAQIREDALDLLADKAHDIISWHAPLIRRPVLSIKAAKRMAHYLADNLLDTLQEREDLPEDVISSVKEVVKKRIEESGKEPEEDGEDAPQEADPMEQVEAMHEVGQLNEDVIRKWIDNGEWVYATSALAVLSGFSRVMVKKIIASQSPKGIMALNWKAGLDPAMSEPLQLKLAKVPMSQLLSLNSDGTYPLTDDELSWHLELFGGS